ncbi:MAG TPA: NHLP leader peptide family RiPP precursor [Candidatus Methylomirabilis sp.]
MATEDSPNKLGEIVSKCWKDAAFKKRFMSDPSSVLREHKIEVPAGVQLKVVENTDKVTYFTLPAAPSAADLSDSQLEKAAGGKAAGISTSPASQLNPKASIGNIFVLYTQSQSTNTCGKSCIPW